MSLATNISSAFTRVGTECKSIRTLVNGNQSTLNALTTTAKTNLVAAINELDAAIDSIVASGSATNLDALTDVTLTGPATGHLLRHNGTVWVNVLGTTFFDAAGAAAAAQAASQPLDADLTALAALAGQTAYGRGLLTLADGAALAALLPAYQPLDSDLTAIAALTTTTYGRALLALADQTALVALLPAYQPLDSDLTAIAAIAGQQNYGRTTLTLSDDIDWTNRVLGATESAQGKIRIATQAETDTGTDNTKAITPLKLQTRMAAYVAANADVSDAKQSVRWVTTGGTDIETNGLTMSNAVVLAAFGGSTNATTEFPVNTRVLIKSDGTNKWNGIYVVATNTGSAVTFARASDMDTWSEVPGAHVFVEGSGVGGGSTLWGTGWVAAAATTGVINNTAISWVPFSPFNTGDKEQARIAMTSNVNLVDPGTNNLSGVSLSGGDRMLLTGQTNPAENGIYTFGSPVSRVYDMDTALEAAAAEVGVKEGVQGGTRWITTFKASDTLNTTPMMWSKIGSATLRLPVKFATTVDVGGSYSATSGGTGTGRITNAGGFNLAGGYAPGDRVLVKDQSSPAQNGIYVVAGGGTMLDRATDADATGELMFGTVVQVIGGTGGALQGTSWMLTTADPITVGGGAGSAMTWTQVDTASGTAGGDLTGTYPNPDIAPGAVDFTTVNTALKPSGSAADASEALRALGYTAKTAMPGVTRLDQIAVPTAAVSVNGQKITNLADNPTIGTDAANKNYVDGLLGASNALVFKGGIDCSTNPNYPAADAGHVYRVLVQGKIGGASGPNVEVNDTLTCTVDGVASGTQLAVGASWIITQTNIDGAVSGPASSTVGNLASFAGTTGKIIQDAGVAVSTDGNLTSNSNAKIPTEAAVRTYAQPYDADLLAIAALTSAANKMPYATGTNNWAMTDLSAFGRTLIAAADAVAARAAGVLDVYSRTEIGDPTTDFVTVFTTALV